MKHVLYSARGWSARGLAVFVMGLLLTGFMTVHQGSPANAARQVPEDPVTLVLQKFEQPNQPGAPTTALPLRDADLAAMNPVGDVVFAVTKVPGTDVTTNQGRRAAKALSVGEAIDRIGSTGPTRSGITNGQGKLSMSRLDTGLYMVEETETPAGVVPAGPFLVMLPMQHPTESGWLDTVHVYPKNSAVDINLSVVDQDAVQTGDDITWQISASIPQQVSLDRYRIVNVLGAGITFGQDLSDIQVALSTGSGLVLDTDYTIESRNADGREGFEISLTSAGRDKLVQARQNNPGARLYASYNAPATTSGEHTNQVQFIVNDAQAVTDTATTKFGDLRVIIHEQNNPANRIPDAVFQLYVSADDAMLERNPLTIAGADRWSTDADGSLRINGLRLSQFVNGLERESSDPLFRFYYLKPVSFPGDWEGSMDPIAVTLWAALAVHEFTLEVDQGTDGQPPSTDDEQTAAPTGDADQQAGVSPPTDGSQGSGGLASTGARVAGLILLALALIAAGFYAVRRRQISQA